MSMDIDEHWAIKLLTEEPGYNSSFMGKWYPYACGVVLGIAAPYISNIVEKRPLYAGFQRYFTHVSVGLIIAHGLVKYSTYRDSKRDAILKDYIRLHPDDFPEPERKKFKEVLQPWIPIR